MTAEPAETPFENVRRTLPRKDDMDNTSCYMGVRGRVPLQALLDHLEQVAPGVAPDAIGITFATVTWMDTATAEERDARAEHKRKREADHEERLRRLYAELKAKYEPETGQPPPDDDAGPRT